MYVKVPQGKYIVAVSGGVDSMVLLDILAKQVTGDRLRVTGKKKKNSNLQPLTSNLNLVVAHFDHGIRPDSAEDADFVRQAASSYRLPLEVEQGRLGASASEDRARKVRYNFLEVVKKKHQATAIITAHHQDDMIETAIINLLRGTGRQGLTSIIQNHNVIRPLLKISKKNIRAYAKKNRLRWREDPTNKDEKYLRNFVRQKIILELSAGQRRKLLGEIQKLDRTNQILNQEIAKLSQNLVDGRVINRADFTSLPTEVAREVLMNFLRDHQIRGFDKKTIERLVVAIKTAKPGTKHDVINGTLIKLTALDAVLSTTD